MRWPITVALACCGAVVGSWSTTVHAQNLNKLGKRLLALEAEADQVRQGIRRPKAVAASGSKASRQMIDAQVAFGVGNYDTAALMLYDFVEKYPNSPDFDTALYYLAESLFQKGDNMAARTYFTRLAKDVGQRSKFYQQGLERLLELSLKNPDEKVQEWLEALDAIPNSDRRPSLPYVRGKYAYFSDSYDEALGFFDKVSKNSRYHTQARYFAGACYVAKKELAKAARTFKALADSKPRGRAAKRVTELAHMALGRLYYERDQPSKAVDEYLRISRKSDLFDEALYEVAWVYVKNKQFDKSLRALELLALADPTSSKLPEVRLLEGNLRIRKAQRLSLANKGNSVEEYDKAIRVFETTHKIFDDPHKQLQEILKGTNDPRTYMAQVTGRHSDVFATENTMPEVAAAWVREQPDVKRVVNIESDLSQIKAEIASATKTIERLDRALTKTTSVNVFPKLAKKRTRALEITEEILSIRETLADRSYKLATNTAADRARLDRLRQQRQTISRQLRDVPGGKLKQGERIAKAKNRYSELEKRAAEISAVITTSEASLVALDKYIADSAPDAIKRRDEAKKLVEELRTEIATMKNELDGINRDITLAKDGAGTMDETSEKLARLRADLLRALDEEFEFHSSALRGDGEGQRIAALVRRGRATGTTLRNAVRAIDDLVEFALGDVRSSLAEEKARLAAYQREFATYEAESRELGGHILGESFAAVKAKFYDVIVQSEIGVIDVTWSRKEAADESTQRLGLDKGRDLRTLTDEFRDVFTALRKKDEATNKDGGSE